MPDLYQYNRGRPKDQQHHEPPQPSAEPYTAFYNQIREASLNHEEVVTKPRGPSPDFARNSSFFRTVTKSTVLVERDKHMNLYSNRWSALTLLAVLSIGCSSAATQQTQEAAAPQPQVEESIVVDEQVFTLASTQARTGLSAMTK